MPHGLAPLPFFRVISEKFPAKGLKILKEVHCENNMRVTLFLVVLLRPFYSEVPIFVLCTVCRIGAHMSIYFLVIAGMRSAQRLSLLKPVSLLWCAMTIVVQQCKIFAV